MASSALEARKKAMDFLAGREHSRAELCRKLEKAGIDAGDIAEAVEQLQQDGLQSDRRFAEAFVQSRINQGKGPARIRAELGERGVRDIDVGIGFDAVSVDWNALAREAREKKFGSSQPADFKEKARQMRFLQYRGFDAEQIQAAVSGRDETP